MPSEELGGGLTLGREGPSGQPHPQKPAQGGFAEDWSIYPPSFDSVGELLARDEGEV